MPTVNTPTIFNVEVGNLGLEVQAGANYSVKLMQEPGLELMSYPGVDINPKEVIEFTLDYTFANAGQKHLYAVVDFLDDEDLSNNTSVPLVIFVQRKVPFKFPLEMERGKLLGIHLCQVEDRAQSHKLYIYQKMLENL